MATPSINDNDFKVYDKLASFKFGEKTQGGFGEEEKAAAVESPSSNFKIAPKPEDLDFEPEKAMGKIKSQKTLSSEVVVKGHMSHKELVTVLDTFKETTLGTSPSKPSIKVEAISRSP